MVKGLRSVYGRATGFTLDVFGVEVEDAVKALKQVYS
jgi:hypothetical protein